MTEAISILLRAIMRTTMRNYTYDTRLGVFISVIDRHNFHIIQTSMFLELDTPKEQNLRLVNMKVSMYFLLIIYPVKEKFVLRDFMIVIIDVFYHSYKKKSTMGYIQHLIWTQNWRATQQTRLTVY